LFLGEKGQDQKIVPTLMFIHENNGKAKEAMELYTQTFPNSSIGNILKYGDGSEGHPIPEPAENVQHAHFVIDRYSLFCMDNSYDHQFDFNEGISLVVMTDDQQQTDTYWNTYFKRRKRKHVAG
jgi:predicted 3-demethylubiquinone-9 3-methyltransferase (glyoxalase superfamily)